MKATWIGAGLVVVVTGSLAAAFAGDDNFDRLTDADRQQFEKRFTDEIWPLLQRGEKKGCFACHGPGGKAVSSLKMPDDPAKTFRMLVKDGFFIPGDSGSLLTRVSSTEKKEMMPPPGKGDRWAKADIEVLHRFVADLDKKQQKKK